MHMRKIRAQSKWAIIVRFNKNYANSQTDLCNFHSTNICILTGILTEKKTHVLKFTLFKKHPLSSIIYNNFFKKITIEVNIFESAAKSIINT